MLNRKIKICLALMAVIATLALIFSFSAQPGRESGRLSREIALWLVPRIVPGFHERAAAEQAVLVSQGELIVRKCAHFSEYALLALTLMNLFHYILPRFKRRNMALLAWFIATAYACTDEFHQRFVESRGPAVTDVLIDSAGALAGVLIGIGILILREKYKQKNGLS